VKHTAGEWSVVGYEIHDPNGAVVAIAPIGGDAEKRGEIEGNLAIMAASKDLLEACELLCLYHNAPKSDYYDEAVVSARAAIKKAKENHQ